MAYDGKLERAQHNTDTGKIMDYGDDGLLSL